MSIYDIKFEIEKECLKPDKTKLSDEFVVVETLIVYFRPWPT